MAKINQGILGSVNGKIGPVIGSTWKGIPYLKSVNKNTAKKSVQSAAQLAHHQKFRFLTKWLQPLHSYFMAGFKNLAQRNTQINLAFSYHFKAAVKGVAPNFHIEYENVRISRGKLAKLHEPIVYLANANTLILTWQNINGSLSAFNDQLILVLYNDEIGVADGLIGGVKRTARSCSFIFDEKLRGRSFHVFAGLIGLDGRNVSESQYLGKIDPL